LAPAVVAVVAELLLMALLLPVLLLEVVVDLALLPVLLLEVVVDLALLPAALVALLLQLLAHKRLPLVLPRDVAVLPQEAEVAAAAVVLQGLVASESLRNR
jgi:hypothetical protein